MPRWLVSVLVFCLYLGSICFLSSRIEEIEPSIPPQFLPPVAPYVRGPFEDDWDGCYEMRNGIIYCIQEEI